MEVNPRTPLKAPSMRTLHEAAMEQLEIQVKKKKETLETVENIVGRLWTGRTPAIYPSLTSDELSGERYPGNGVNLDIYSDRERMCRLLECLEARLTGCEIRGDREGYEALLHQRDNVEGLTWIATDLRPGGEEEYYGMASSARPTR